MKVEQFETIDTIIETIAPVDLVEYIQVNYEEYSEEMLKSLEQIALIKATKDME